MNMTREQILEQQRKASEAALARLMAETEQTISEELAETAKGEQKVFEYIPDGEKASSTRRNRTRSGRWLLDEE